MRLQSMILPPDDLIFDGIDTGGFDLFVRARNGVITQTPEGDSVLIGEGCRADFDTLFGAFFSQKWLRYTAISGLWAELELCGRTTVSCWRGYIENGENKREKLAELEADTAGEFRAVRIYVPEIRPESMYYICIEALSETRVRDAYFGCDNDDDADEVNICVGICTYKREQYVENTLAAIERGIFRKKSSAVSDHRLAEHLKIYISDNGQSLDAARLENDRVRVFPNRNCGGTGGFTRCMIEIMRAEPGCTHILLMDDDITLPVRSVETTYSFLRLLKPEHKDISVGGALWQADCPWLQYEAGAGWDGCSVIPYGHGTDLRSAEMLLENSVKNELIDYNGWWFTCIPVLQIKRVGLPLPLFLHRDDIEYGLRLRGRFVIPDGVGVWHETFEAKMSGASEYYDLRNMLIVNSIHRPLFTRSDYLAFIRKWYLRNVFSHRYKYIVMNLTGVRDALRGIDWLQTGDPEKIHERVTNMDYVLGDVRSLADSIGLANCGERYGEQLRERFDPDRENERKRVSPLRKTVYSALTVAAHGGIDLPQRREPMLAVHPAPIWEFFASGVILHADASGRGFVTRRSRTEIHRCRELYGETKRQLTSWYELVCSEYRARWKELTTEEFWRGYLKISR